MFPNTKYLQHFCILEIKLLNHSWPRGGYTKPNRPIVWANPYRSYQYFVNMTPMQHLSNLLNIYIHMSYSFILYLVTAYTKYLLVWSSLLSGFFLELGQKNLLYVSPHMACSYICSASSITFEVSGWECQFEWSMDLIPIDRCNDFATNCLTIKVNNVETK